ncbi:NADPH-dependent F420 reductase [Kribbella soli]|uniref:NADP oxidoreductase n=1 Tax=Kribbella soli TaxID=1124743 RepID=A0A4R0HG40_9ACTN|nr:NAD(P)-binding domain-containing protein [Kribbella soli]TCC08644.1 NADP oxidoreductase [Kribbella soli]
MASISIIGLGNMAKVLGARAIAGGNTVEFVGRDADKASALARTVGGGSTSVSMDAAPSGDIVILAVPWESAVPVVQQYGAALDAKIIIDISNTFDLSEYGGRHVPADTSVAQEIAEVAGETAQVFKAFNTIFGTVFSRNEQVDALFAGNDGRAKEEVAAFIKSLGLRPVYAGPLVMARALEEAGLLVMGLGRWGEKNYEFSLAVRKRSDAGV